MISEGTAQNLEVQTEVANNTPKRINYKCKDCNIIPEIKVIAPKGKIKFICSKKHKFDIDLGYKDNKKNDSIDEHFKYQEEQNNAENNDLVEDEEEIINEKKAVEIIQKKIQDSSNIIRANIKLLDIQEKFPDNYLHNKNVINSGEIIQKTEKIFDSQDGIKIIEEIEKNKKDEENILKDLEKKNIYLGAYLDDEELFLNIKGEKEETEKIKYLKDDGLKLLSQLIFKNLIGLNLSNNKLKDISPLDNMFLPHLEVINLSDNEIKDASAVAYLNSKYLTEIYLHNNKIEDLGEFLKSNFPYLEAFRIDDNNGNKYKEKSNWKAVLKKYKNSIYYEAKDWRDFIKKYNFNFPVSKESKNLNELGKNDFQKLYDDLVKIDLGSRKEEKLLIDLQPLIIYPNKIKFLILDDNQLQNVSILTRFPLYNLEVLDLSLNLITNIKFLKRLSTKFELLKALYLNDNKINDISHLVKYREKKEIIFKNLEILTLKNNKLDLKDNTTFDILKTYIDKLDYNKEDLENV